MAHVEADVLYPHHINSQLLHLIVTSSFVFFFFFKKQNNQKNVQKGIISTDRLLILMALKQKDSQIHFTPSG